MRADAKFRCVAKNGDDAPEKSTLILESNCSTGVLSLSNTSMYSPERSAVGTVSIFGYEYLYISS